MIHHRDAFGIGKLHIGKFHIEGSWISGSLLIRLRLTEDVVHAADALQDAAGEDHHLHHVFQRLLQSAAHQKEQQNDGQEIQIAVCRGDEQQGRRKQEQKLRPEKGIIGAHGPGVGPCRPLHHIGEVIQVALVPAEGAEGPVEHLHHTHAVDVLYHGALHPLLGIVKFCLKGRLVRLSETGGQHPEGDADGQQRHQRQPPIHEKQVQQGEHRRGYRRSDFAQMVGQERFNLVGVIGDNLF